MSLNADRAQLLALTRELAAKWQETKNNWSDAKSREFENQYMNELLINVDKSAMIIEQLDKLANQIRSDCE